MAVDRLIRVESESDPLTSHVSLQFRSHARPLPLPSVAAGAQQRALLVLVVRPGAPAPEPGRRGRLGPRGADLAGGRASLWNPGTPSTLYRPPPTDVEGGDRSGNIRLYPQ
jgi:hypothetical protein